MGLFLLRRKREESSASRSALLVCNDSSQRDLFVALMERFGKRTTRSTSLSSKNWTPSRLIKLPNKYTPSVSISASTWRAQVVSADKMPEIVKFGRMRQLRV